MSSPFPEPLAGLQHPRSSSVLGQESTWHLFSPSRQSLYLDNPVVSHQLLLPCVGGWSRATNRSRAVAQVLPTSAFNSSLLS